MLDHLQGVHYTENLLEETLPSGTAKFTESLLNSLTYRIPAPSCSRNTDFIVKTGRVHGIAYTVEL